MNLKLIVNIAQSLLRARWRQTLVAAVGVTFGITMFIALLSFMSGLNDLLDGLVVNRTPHIRLYNDIRPRQYQPVTLWPAYQNSYPVISSLKSGNIRQEIYNSGPIIRALQQNKQVMGVAPTITAQVFFNDGTVDINGVINGIDVAAETRLFHFDDYIVAGKASNLNTVPNSIILGKALAEKLVANVGDVVQITTSNGAIFQLKVVGYFQSGLTDFDKAQSYASINTTQKILGKSAFTSRPAKPVAFNIVLEHVSEYHYPVAFHFPVSHGESNLTVKLGVNYQLIVSEKEVVLKEGDSF